MEQLPGLDAAVDELYGLDPADFVARRDELAKAARQAKDRTLANAIKALRRPTVGAWYVNIAARANLLSLKEFLELGRQLRAAQAAQQFTEVVALGPRRAELERRVLADLTAHLSQLGITATPAALEEVRSTLRATLADAESADAVASGHLDRPLTYGELGDGLAAALATMTGAGRPSTDAAGADANKAKDAPARRTEPAEQDMPGRTSPAAETPGGGDAEQVDTADTLPGQEEAAEPPLPDPEPEPDQRERTQTDASGDEGDDELAALEQRAREAEEALRASQAALQKLQAERDELRARRGRQAAEKKVAAARTARETAQTRRDDLAAQLADADQALADAEAALDAAQNELDALGGS